MVGSHERRLLSSALFQGDDCCIVEEGVLAGIVAITGMVGNRQGGARAVRRLCVYESTAAIQTRNSGNVHRGSDGM